MTYSEKMLESLKNQDLEQAKLDFQAAMKRDSDDILIQLAYDLQGLGFLYYAKEIFEKMLEKYPEEDDLYINLSDIAMDDGEVDLAFEYLEKVLPSSPNYLAALVAQSNLYQELGIFEVSIEKIKQALQLEPQNEFLQFALAEIYYSAGKTNQAIHLYAKLNVDEINKTTGVCIYERIGFCFINEGKFEKAVPFLEKASSDTAEQALQVAFALAMVYENIGEVQKAIQTLRQLVENFPEEERVHGELATLLFEERQEEEAYQIIQQGIKAQPFVASYYQLASELAYRLGKMDESEDFLLQSITLDELRDESLYRLMCLYEEQERYMDVKRAYEELEESEHPYANWLLARIYHKNEESAEAEKYFEQAFHSLTDDDAFLLAYALFQREQGRLAEAKTLLQKSLQINPENDVAQEYLFDLENLM